MNSPYKNIHQDNWETITERLINDHPLEEKVIVDIVLSSWEQIFDSKIGTLHIGKEIEPTPQIMSAILHELVAHNLSLKYPGKYRVGTKKSEKDVVCENNEKYSVEIKGSSHPNQIFANRSYAQPSSDSETKEKNGYYITINFEKFSEKLGHRPSILLIRFGYLEHSDWVAQVSSTGQQARLRPETYKSKLKVIYNAVKKKTKKTEKPKKKMSSNSNYKPSKKTNTKLTKNKSIRLKKTTNSKSNKRNLSIEMRQIFYLIKQHFLMVNHRFGVYLSTPEHQAF
jgi:hypothetical protein